MAVKTYRKTALVTAEQFLPAVGQIPKGVYASDFGDPKSHPLSEWVLDTKEARHTLRGGDYICTGLAGEQWNVAQEIFEATYEEMMSAEPSHIAQAEAFMKGALGKGYRQNVEGLAALLANTAETALTEAKAREGKLVEALRDLMTWFPDEPSQPEWRLTGGERGADDAVAAARAALKETTNEG